MRTLASIIDHELAWNQPGAFKSQFELRFGDELVGTLRFPKFLRSLAEAETGDGHWTFQRVGFWKKRTVVRVPESETEVAVYVPNTWKQGGTLEVENGGKILVEASRWKRTLHFKTEAGESLVDIKFRGTFRQSATVQMYRKALQVGALPWMVPLGLYLFIMMQRDAAAHAAASG
jgi:hypothetical protein